MVFKIKRMIQWFKFDKERRSRFADKRPIIRFITVTKICGLLETKSKLKAPASKRHKVKSDSTHFFLREKLCRCEAMYIQVLVPNIVRKKTSRFPSQ